MRTGLELTPGPLPPPITGPPGWALAGGAVGGLVCLRLIAKLRGNRGWPGSSATGMWEEATWRLLFPKTDIGRIGEREVCSGPKVVNLNYLQSGGNRVDG